MMIILAPEFEDACGGSFDLLSSELEVIIGAAAFPDRFLLITYMAFKCQPECLDYKFLLPQFHLCLLEQESR